MTNTAPPAPAPSAPHLKFIDGLRGVAMLMVLLFHSYVFGGQWKLAIPGVEHPVNPGPLFSVGSIGVSLFLVLSGFCLYWPFASAEHRPASGRRELTLKQFALRRCQRILPPYYIALVLFVVIQVGRNYFAPAHQEMTGGDSETAGSLTASFLLHLSMLHNTRPEYFFDINGSFWSLALEFHLYLLFPLFVEAFRRWPKLIILIGVFLAVSAFRFAALKAGGMVVNPSVNVLTYSVFGRCFEFVLGMYAASRIARRTLLVDEKHSLVSLSDLLMGVGIFVVSLVGYKMGYAEVFKAAVTGLLFTGILLAASCPGTLLNRALSARAIVTLGTISYSVYLIHHPLVAALGEYAASHNFTSLQNMLFMWLCVIPAALLLGAVYHRYFERPFMRTQGKKAPVQKETILETPKELPGAILPRLHHAPLLAESGTQDRTGHSSC